MLDIYESIIFIAFKINSNDYEFNYANKLKSFNLFYKLTLKIYFILKLMALYHIT